MRSTIGVFLPTSFRGHASWRVPSVFGKGSVRRYCICNRAEPNKMWVRMKIRLPSAARFSGPSPVEKAMIEDINDCHASFTNRSLE